MINLNRKVLSFLFIFHAVYFSFAQPFTERSDGNTYASNTTYYNRSIKDKESSTTDYINFYQKYISEIRGQECPMYPSCSNFGLKSFKETNVFLAFALTSDRLLRCGHDPKNYSITLRNNGFKNLDFPWYDTPPQELYYTGNSYFYAYSDSLKDSSNSVKLVKALINDGLFSEALLEIKRLQYSQQATEAELFINELICLKALGEFEKAIYVYEMRCPASLKQDPEILYQLAVAYYNLNSFDKAIEIVNNAVSITTNQYTTARLYSFQALLYAKLYNWEKAALSFEQLKSFPHTQKTAQEKLSFIKSELPLKEKSPSLAAAISIIPGAGYAYAGHKQTAISAFIINGLLTYATYSNIKNKNYGMSLLTGAFNLSFYIGNIYGASKSAKRYNESKKQNLINKLIYNIKP